MDEAPANEPPRRHTGRTLAVQLGTFTSLLLILTGLSLGYVGYAVGKRIVRDQIHQRLQLAATDRKELIHEYVDRQKERVALVASRTRLRALIADYLNGDLELESLREATLPILRDALTSTKDFRSISIVSTAGEVLTTTEVDTDNLDLATTEAFRTTLSDQHQSEGFLGEPFVFEGQLLSRLAAPAISGDGQVLGIVVVVLNVERLESILRDVSDSVGFGETGELLLGRRDGDEIHYLLPSGRDYKQATRAAAAPGMVAAIEGGRGFVRAVYDQVPVLMYYEPIAYQDRYRWGLVAKIDESEAYRPLAHLRNTLLLVQAGLLGFGLLGAWLLARRFTRPIKKLSQAAHQFAAGDLSQRVHVTKRTDELGELADSFNEMAENLQQLNSHLEQMVQARTSELAVARDDAEAANRAKSDFLANMSHEIRTPLNAVIGLTEIMLSTELNDTQREYLTTVIDSAESLLTIINDILDFSKIEAGKLDLEEVSFNLQDMVGDALRSLAVRSRQKDLELACLVDPELPSVMVGDPARLRQVVTNLVANAVKFTHRGEVVVRISASSEEPCGQEPPPSAKNEKIARRQQLLFTVSDTGIGIEPKNLVRLFEAFEQGDTSTARRFGGTGLGLSICVRLVQKMRGRMWAESTPGEGSKFHFTTNLGVPIAVAKRRPKLTVPLEGMRVLIVDDNATNRQILFEVTRAKQMLPELADSAQAGLAIMQQAIETGNPISLILSDVNMPDQDGFDLAKMIRADSRFDQAEIIFLTSAGQPDDQQRCADLRIAARLMKPVKQSELFEVMVRTLGVEGYSSVTFARPSEQPAEEIPPLEILLAEDSVPNQKVATAVLHEQHHTVAIANDGCEALRCLESRQFDVVLMDVQMPNMDGLETTRVIRQQESGTDRHQPIVAMTAEAIDGDREKCLAAGMDDYVTKPIRRNELFAALARVTGHSSTSGDAPTGSRSPGVGGVVSHSNQSIDWSGPLRNVNHDHDLLRSVVGHYVAEIRDNLSTLPSCISDSDAKEVQRRAHMLAGSMKMFGVHESMQYARELEDMAAKQDLGQADAVYQDLNSAVGKVLPELERFLESEEV